MKKTTTGRCMTIFTLNPYMAPEMQDHKGYTFSSDLWPIGVMMYEFLIGKLPSNSWDSKDPYKLQQEIMKN